MKRPSQQADAGRHAPETLPGAVVVVIIVIGAVSTLDDLRLGLAAGFPEPIRSAQTLLAGLAVIVSTWRPLPALILLWLGYGVALTTGHIGVIALAAVVVSAVAAVVATMRVVILQVGITIAVAIVDAVRWPDRAGVLLWGTALAVALALAIGLSTRSARASRRVAARRQAEAAAAHASAAQAAEQERNRIARDMHDFVAHELTIAAATIAGARSARSDAPISPEALDQVERSNTRALDELRAALRVLRADPAAIVQPDAAVGAATDLPALMQASADDLRRIGFDVEAHLEPIVPITDPTRETARRVLVEAVTNVVKYGDLEHGVRLTLATESERLLIEVENGQRAPAAEPGESTQMGLVGLLRDVQAAGGSLRSVAVVPDRWLLRLDLPLPLDD